MESIKCWGKERIWRGRNWDIMFWWCPWPANWEIGIKLSYFHTFFLGLGPVSLDCSWEKVEEPFDYNYFEEFEPQAVPFNAITGQNVESTVTAPPLLCTDTHCGACRAYGAPFCPYQEEPSVSPLPPFQS